MNWTEDMFNVWPPEDWRDVIITLLDMAISVKIKKEILKHRCVLCSFTAMVKTNLSFNKSLWWAITHKQKHNTTVLFHHRQLSGFDVVFLFLSVFYNPLKTFVETQVCFSYSCDEATAYTSMFDYLANSSFTAAPHVNFSVCLSSRLMLLIFSILIWNE
jgi:hypothetical protein